MSYDYFISYRRDDSLAEARAVYERMRAEFGTSAVFIDLDGIEYGADFHDSLESTLSGCRVMLLLIGRNWLGIDSHSGSRRIDDKLDFIRVETAFGLAHEIRVIPILINGAQLPTADNLPQDLQALTRKQFLELDFRRFDSDVGRLIATLRRPRETVESGKEVRANVRPEPQIAAIGDYDAKVQEAPKRDHRQPLLWVDTASSARSRTSAPAVEVESPPPQVTRDASPESWSDKILTLVGVGCIFAFVVGGIAWAFGPRLGISVAIAIVVSGLGSTIAEKYKVSDTVKGLIGFAAIAAGIASYNFLG